MAENANRPTPIRRAAIYPNLASPTGYRYKKIKNVPGYEGEEAGVWREQEVPYHEGEVVPSPEQIERFRRESPNMAARMEQEAKRLANLVERSAELGAAGANSPPALNRGLLLNVGARGNENNAVNRARQRLEAARKRMGAVPANHNEVPLGGAGAAAGSPGGAAAAPAPLAHLAPPGLASMFSARGENVAEFESEWARHAEKGKGGKRKARKTRKTRKNRSTRKRRAAGSGRRRN